MNARNTYGGANRTPRFARKALSALLVAGFAGGALGAANALAIGSAADIEIYDRTANRRLPVYWHDGRAYVVGQPGNEYQIRVANRGGGDVLAVVSVDGVNAVSGETAAPDQTGYVLSGWRRFDILGWRKSLMRTAAFYFTELPDSYAARTGRPDNIGVIGVALFQRKAVEPPVAIAPVPSPPARPEAYDYRSRQSDSPPRDAQSSPSAAAGKEAAGASNGTTLPAPQPAAPASESQPLAADGVLAQRAAPLVEKSLGTGHGRSETSVVRNVAFERASPYPQEVVTIYYDSLRNLMARGIIPAVPPAAPPQPFPGGFVPDPPRG